MKSEAVLEIQHDSTSLQFSNNMSNIAKIGKKQQKWNQLVNNENGDGRHPGCVGTGTRYAQVGGFVEVGFEVESVFVIDFQGQTMGVRK